MVVEFTGSCSLLDDKKTVFLLERIDNIRHSLHLSAQLRTQFVRDEQRFLTSYVCYVFLTLVSMETYSFYVVITGGRPVFENGGRGEYKDFY